MKSGRRKSAKPLQHLEPPMEEEAPLEHLPRPSTSSREEEEHAAAARISAMQMAAAEMARNSNWSAAFSETSSKEEASRPKEDNATVSDCKNLVTAR